MTASRDFFHALRALVSPDVRDGAVSVVRTGDQATVTLTLPGQERPMVSATVRITRPTPTRQQELFEAPRAAVDAVTAGPPTPEPSAPSEPDVTTSRYRYGFTASELAKLDASAADELARYVGCGLIWCDLAGKGSRAWWMLRPLDPANSAALFGLCAAQRISRLPRVAIAHDAEQLDKAHDAGHALSVSEACAKSRMLLAHTASKKARKQSAAPKAHATTEECACKGFWIVAVRGPDGWRPSTAPQPTKSDAIICARNDINAHGYDAVMLLDPKGRPVRLARPKGST